MADLEKIEEKIEKGEELTADEKAEVMSAPNVEGEATQAAEAKLENDEKPAKLDSKIAEDEGEKGAPAKKDPDQEVDTEKLLGDLELPEDEVDLTGYSPREKGLFKALREERSKGQEAQRQADQLAFEKAQTEYKRKQAEAAAQDAESKAILEGLDDDDFLTAGQAKKILNLVKKNTGETISKEPGIPDEPLSKVELENYALKAFMADTEPESFALASQNMESLLMNDTEAQATIAKAKREGKNPVELAVKLVRQHPKWAQIKAKAFPAKPAAPKKDDNQERLKRLQDNENKPKQLGAGGGGSEASGDEYTLEEYANMDPEEIARLPRSKRKAILEKFGA